MGARTTIKEVQKILDYDTAICNIDAFIDAANELVTEICASSTPTVYTEKRLKVIETWLAAHFIAVRDQRKASEGVGGGSASYQTKVDMGLQVTVYGQQALRLDTNGGLAALEQSIANGGKRVVSITWLGSPPRTWDRVWRYQGLWNY